MQFSLLGLYRAWRDTAEPVMFGAEASSADMEDALLYLSKIGALTLEGGFLVLYNRLDIKRLVTDNKIRYKLEDYRLLNEFYKQRIQQIHIVGEYANLMVRDYDAALRFVRDYFQMDFSRFIAQYFKGERAAEISRNITPGKYRELFGGLSETQCRIVNDGDSKYIVAVAGPGSGKTRVLVHKLAALLLLEDVKHEQLLMLTFSRAAATEFKKRLLKLVGNAANFVKIKTFHSYCFDLLGRVGRLEETEHVVRDAAAMINEGEAEMDHVTKAVVVIDEAQDMDKHEFALMEALMRRNETMRVIAVGDDDQNIYEFRGSDSKHLRSFITDHHAVKYEMSDNYRSKSAIVALANAFAADIGRRMKSEPIRALRQESGIVQLVKHSSANLEAPVVNHIQETYRSGSVCILTNTNGEALRVLGLLLQKGCRARLIQSNDGFRLQNLAEIRFFLETVDKNLTSSVIEAVDKKVKSSVIADELWHNAKEQLCCAYGESANLAACLNMIEDFAAVNHVKYRTDLEEFIKESAYEDFCRDDKEVIVVSTMHKAKGREFDSVYMLLRDAALTADEERRKIYVGLSRAKNELYIHYNHPAFDRYAIPQVQWSEDKRAYAAPEELILQLSHRDVVLDFFKDKKDIIGQLRGGGELKAEPGFMSLERDGGGIRVLKYSRAFLERLAELGQKGYRPYKAMIRFILAWKGEHDEDESAVILPDLYLSRVRA